jgi:hypothetical protein
MAHFAEINNDGIVQRVIVVANEQCIDPVSGQEDEILGIAFCKKIFGGNWVQTSYNKKVRNKFAGIGDKYDKDLDIFIPPQPFSSWSLNMETFEWEAPIPKPSQDEIENKIKEAKFLKWDEENIRWKWEYDGH